MAMIMNESPSPCLSLVVRRLVDGDPAAAFAAWTDPDRIKSWWGPDNVECPQCQVDLRVGGSYAIANRFADGSIVWIRGEYTRIEPPHLVAYTWRTGPERPADPRTDESVTVRFVARAHQTEVIITHRRLADQSVLDSHETGWTGCLDGFSEYLGGPAGSEAGLR